MMGWFMIEYKFYDNAVRVTIGEFSKYVEIHDSDGDYVVFIPDEIDYLIAALQKAKAIMAIDKSK